ncbi:hypothetical protein CK203_005869 [Vitis vinifera]|uniref:Uncharacterized protein n=1 Tax=Vitis vinifera TaxID=29760 RepID=A0A438K5D8_VITVI|nr:hypothetical protein CK203_005869 [Vitis vinifera]
MLGLSSAAFLYLKMQDNVAAEKATMEMTILALCMTQTKGTKGTTPSIPD